MQCLCSQDGAATITEALWGEDIGMHTTELCTGTEAAAETATGSAAKSETEGSSTNLLEPSMFERVARRVAERLDQDPDVSWRKHASCRDTDPDLFFPVGTTGLAVSQIDEAKAVCMGCPAQIQCLEFALIANQDTGVWGGSSEEERRQLRRKYLSRRRSRL